MEFWSAKGKRSTVKPSVVFFRNELAELGASGAVRLDMEKHP